MRSTLIVLLSALPILGDAQQQQKVPQKVSQKIRSAAHIESASVLFGPGIIQDRSGETPPPAFEAKLSGELSVEGFPAGLTPRFRFWLAKAEQEEKLRAGSPHSAGARLLDHAITGKTETGRITFSISWANRGAVGEKDRLFVEVFRGRRRVATAISAIQSHYLPASHPRGGEVEN